MSGEKQILQTFLLLFALRQAGVHFQFRTLGDYWLGTLGGISLLGLFFQPETIVCRWTVEEWALKFYHKCIRTPNAQPAESARVFLRPRPES
jgi:hypothetical protein